MHQHEFLKALRVHVYIFECKILFHFSLFYLILQKLFRGVQKLLIKYDNWWIQLGLSSFYIDRHKYTTEICLSELKAHHQRAPSLDFIWTSWALQTFSFSNKRLYHPSLTKISVFYKSLLTGALSLTSTTCQSVWRRTKDHRLKLM